MLLYKKLLLMTFGTTLVFQISPQLLSSALFAHNYSSIFPTFKAKSFQPYRWLSIVTRLRAADQEIGVLFTAEAKESILQNGPDQLCERNNLLLNEYRFLFIRGKAAGA